MKPALSRAAAAKTPRTRRPVAAECLECSPRKSPRITIRKRWVPKQELYYRKSLHCNYFLRLVSMLLENDLKGKLMFFLVSVRVMFYLNAKVILSQTHHSRKLVVISIEALLTKHQILFNRT